jgi:hypothetical protein
LYTQEIAFGNCTVRGYGYRQTSTGDVPIPYVRAGRNLRFDPEKVIQFLEQHTAASRENKLYANT